MEKYIGIFLSSIDPLKRLLITMSPIFQVLGPKTVFNFALILGMPTPMYKILLGSG